MAVDVRYVGTRGVNQWSELNYNTRDIEFNGFINEFKLAVANLQANNASGVATRAGSFAYFGAGTGTSPLPIYLAYLNAQPGREQLGRLHRERPGRATGFTQDMAFRNPSPGNSAADLDGDNDAAHQRASRRASRRTSSSSIRPSTDNNVTDSGAFSDYHALQIDLRRRLSQGLSASVNYQYALEGGSAFHGFAYGRVMNPSSQRAPCDQDAVGLDDPGRPRPALRDGHATRCSTASSAAGRSTASAASRRAMVNFGNVSLVGMTPKDLQKMYKHDIRIDPASGLRTVYMLPDDVILNTRRAFSVSQSTADRLQHGAGRARRPVHRAGQQRDLHQLKPGDCAPRTLLIRAPWFTRFDVGVTKKFTLKGRSNIEVPVRRAEPVRQHQLQHRGQPGHRRDDLPGEQRLSGREQHLRSWRPPRPVDVPHQLVGRHDEEAGGWIPRLFVGYDQSTTGTKRYEGRERRS